MWDQYGDHAQQDETSHLPDKGLVAENHQICQAQPPKQVRNWLYEDLSTPVQGKRFVEFAKLLQHASSAHFFKPFEEAHNCNYWDHQVYDEEKNA